MNVGVDIDHFMNLVAMKVMMLLMRDGLSYEESWMYGKAWYEALGRYEFVLMADPSLGPFKKK